MAERQPRLVVHTSPFLRQGVTTPGLMGDVLVALLPVLAFAVWNFGLPALLVVLSATLGSVGTEWLASRGRTRASRDRQGGAGGAATPAGASLSDTPFSAAVSTTVEPPGGPLHDRTALLTGVILGLTLPPTFPLWMAFLGGVVAIGLGKLIWGGLGENLFNPALVGRAFLQAAFPLAITTWTAPASVSGEAGGGWSDWLRVPPGQLAWPLMSPEAASRAAADAVTTATPLNQMKFAGEAAPVTDLFLGGVAGSAGETSALVILLAGAYLLARRAFDWRIPTAVLLTVFLFSGLLWLLAPEAHPTPWFMVFSGGLLFGAVFMATDPVTSPLAPRGAWIFGFGVGFLVVLIRLWGGLPEGVMYAILLMNAATPLLERAVQPRPFGHGGRAGA